ncbi:MAG: right-handed parallel beta-helix repeat-containing protein [Spirochaetaceae bacterium]|nr:MAG: right-handed parallel beta-helix repeat-containing protein [Spirochaetaceae bacterium]
MTLAAGDAVLLDAASVWNEPLRLTGCGSPEEPIVLGSYGREIRQLPGWEVGFRLEQRPMIIWREGAVVELSDVSHWIVRDLAIECSSESTLYPELRRVDDPSTTGQPSRHPAEGVNYGILVRTSAGSPQRGISIESNYVRGRGPNQNSEGILVSSETTESATEPTLCDIAIRNNLVESVGWRGIGTGGRSINPGTIGIPWIPLENLTMEGNAARDVGLQGICAFNAHEVVMRRNLVDGAGQYRGVGAKWGPAGLWPWSCAHVLIEFNEVTNMFDGNTGADATGIDIDRNRLHVTERSNHVYGNMGSGIVTMSCHTSSIESNRIEGNLAKVNMGPGQIGLSDYQTEKGEHGITGIRDPSVEDNLIILDRDNTTALSPVRISDGAWERIGFHRNRVVFFDHARGQYAYDIQPTTKVDSMGANRFYGVDADAFSARIGDRTVDWTTWQTDGYDADASFSPLDGTSPSVDDELATTQTDEGVRLSWRQSEDSLSGVHHYNVYRGSDRAFEPRYLTLIGQPETPEFLDPAPATDADQESDPRDARETRDPLRAVERPLRQER